MAIYYIHAGEGETGDWHTHSGTDASARRHLRDQRCSGDRWARAYVAPFALRDGGHAARCLESGAVRPLPAGLVTVEGGDA